MDGGRLPAYFFRRDVLREGGRNREQKDNGGDRSRKPDPGAAPDGAVRKSGLEKQRWDWINIPAHAKTWKTFLSVCSGEPLPLADYLLLAIPDDTIPIYCLPPLPQLPGKKYRLHGSEGLGPAFHRPSPPKTGQSIVLVCRYNFASGGLRNTLFLMVPEGIPAIAKESRCVA